MKKECISPHDEWERRTPIRREFPPNFNPDRYLSEIKEEATKHEGEFVLVISRHWQKTSFDMPEERTHYMVEQEIKLGTITAPFIEAEGGMGYLHIATPKFAELSNRLWGKDIVEVKKGPIEDFWVLKHFINMPLDGKSVYQAGIDAKNPGVALEIIVGDEKVRQWFEGEVNRDVDEHMLKIKNEKLREECIRNHRYLQPFSDFIRLADKIGRPVTDVPKDIEEYIEGQKLRVVSKLLELAEAEDKILKRLADIKGVKYVPLGNGINFADIDEQGSDDLEDLKILRSIQPNEDLKRLQAKAKRCLEVAFGWGMHENDWKIEKEEKPGVTTTIDVKRLIHGLCQYHEIPIPQEND